MEILIISLVLIAASIINYYLHNTNKHKIDKILLILNSLNPGVSKQVNNKIPIDIIDLNQQNNLEARDKALSKINSTDDNYIYEEDYLEPEERELI